MQNFGTAYSATATAINSSGSAMKENEKALDSIQGRVQNLKSEIEGFATKTINSDFVKSIITAITNIIKFTDKIGGAETILTIITGILVSKFTPAIFGGAKSILSLVANIAKGNIAFTSFNGKLQESGKNINSATVKINGYKLAIMALTAIIATYNAVQAEAQAAEEENKASVQSAIEKKEEDINTLKEQITTYKELLEMRGKASTEEESISINKELLNLQEKIRDTIGDQGKQIDLVNGKYEEQTDILNNKLLSSLKEQEESLEASVEIAKSDYLKGIGASSDLGTQKDKWYSMGRKLSGAGINWETDVEKVGIKLNSSYTDLYTALKKGNVEQQIQLLEQWEDKLIKISKSGKDVEEQLVWVRARLDGLKNSQNQYNGATDKLLQNQATQKFYEMGGAAIKTQEDYDKFIESVKGTDDPLKQFNDNIGLLHLSDLDEKILEIAENAFPKYSAQTQSATSSTFDFKSSLESINDSIDNTQSAMSVLDQAIYEYNSSGGLTVDTLQSLIALGGDYTSMLEFQNGTLQLSAEGREALNEKMQQNIENSIALAMYNELLQLSEGKVREGASDVTEYISQMADTLKSRTGDVNSMTQAILGLATAQAAASNKEFKGVSEQDAQAIVSKYQNIMQNVSGASKKSISGIGSGKYSGVAKKTGSGGSKSSTKDTWKEAFETQYKELQHSLKMDYITEEEYTNQLEALYKKYFSNKTKYSEEYMKYEEEVYTKRKQLYEDSFKEELNALKHNLNMGLISERTYTNQLEALYKKYYANKAEYLEEYQKYQEEVYADIKSYIEEDYEAAISLATDAIDKQIEELEKQKEALEDKNDEEDRAIELQKLQNALFNARNQKNIRVYYEGIGWVWESNAEAIEEAQKALDDFETEEQISKIDDEIDSLQELKDGWSNIASDYEKAQDRINVALRFGADFEEQVLNGRLDFLKSFVNKYNAEMDRLNPNISASNTSTSSAETSSTGITPSVNVSNIGNTLKKGARGDNVKSLQTALNEILGTNLTVDGIFGTNTYNAVKQFQNLSGITSDGIVGANTKSAFAQRGYANGTLSAESGISLVGEEGAELRILNQGDGIIPADLTKNLMQWGRLNPINLFGGLSYPLTQKNSNSNGINYTFHISNVSLPNVNNADSFVKELRQFAITHDKK